MKLIKCTQHFLALIIALFCCSISYSQTKQEAVDALKETLKGQITHMIYGAPCSNNSGSSWKHANIITITNVKFDYNILQIEYSFPSDDGKPLANIKNLNMNNYFVIKDKGIAETKKPDSNSCADIINVPLTFDESAKSSQDRTLKILNYLRQFAKNDPF